jgi:hypothetical protein
MSKSRTTYCIEYAIYTGQKRIFKDRLCGGIKEFNSYERALKMKNWFLDKGFEDVVIKEIKY